MSMMGRDHSATFSSETPEANYIIPFEISCMGGPLFFAISPLLPLPPIIPMSLRHKPAIVDFTITAPQPRVEELQVYDSGGELIFIKKWTFNTAYAFRFELPKPCPKLGGAKILIRHEGESGFKELHVDYSRGKFRLSWGYLGQDVVGN